MLSNRSMQLLHRATSSAPRGFLLHTVNVALSTCPISQQSRASSFLNDNSVASTTRPSQQKSRTSWLSRRRKERNTRSKISTLALDRRSAMFGIEGTLSENAAEDTRDQGNEQEGKQSNPGMLTSRRRRLLMWTAILTMPIWGRDILEAVVPGLIGVIIQTAGNIKAGIHWVRGLSPGKGRD